MRRFLFLIAILLQCGLVFSQVSINTQGTPPHPSAGLDINFTDKGFLLPRMTFEQRNAIPTPADGLIIYCTNCGFDGAGVLSIYQNGIWREFNIDCVEPVKPSAGNRVPSTNSILWNWSGVPIALGYKFNTVNDISTAIDLGSQTSYLETGLDCWTTYTRYIWAYNDCGNSSSLTLTESTLEIPFSPAPTGAFHFADPISIIWDWYEVAGATGYKWNTTNDPATAIDLGNTSVYFEQGLNCFTTYTRYIWAYDDCGISSSTSISQTTLADPPNTPAAGTHVPAVTQITWNWSTSSDAEGYKINTTNNYSTATDLGNATSYSESGLTCNTPYNRYVWAYSVCGVTPSVLLSATTLPDPPPSPVAATHVPGISQIVWNWNTVTGASGYKWNTTNSYSTAIDVGVATFVIETGLLCNIVYTRYVWAYGPCGVSNVTTLSQSTSLSPPASPVAGTHVPMATQITWNWNTVPDADGYKWNTTNDYGTAQEMGTSTSKAETGLTCNTGYTRYVWAYSECGVSAPSALSQTTSLSPPPAPTAAMHTATSTQIVWNWNAVVGATGYKWNTTNDYGSAQDMGSTTSKTETGLTCNLPYTRYVWAYSNCGVSNATTLNQNTAQNPPSAPTAGTHVPQITQITWNWNSVAGAAGYRWNTSNDYGSAQDMGTATSKVETGLLCNSAYTRFVWSYNNCGVSTPISLTQATLQNPPASPLAGTHTSTVTQITWNWTAVSGATGYRWNTVNNYSTATDMGTNTSRIESGLTCNTSYTRYVWAYSSCGVSPSTALTFSTLQNPPAAPVAGTHNPSPTQIVWNWNTVSGAAGYRWNTTNDYGSAQNMGTATTRTETGLVCNTAYTRYVWAYNSCGVSISTSLASTTTNNPPSVPTVATHTSTPTQINWDWNASSGATGYRFHTENNYAGATDLGNVTFFTESGLICNTGYTRYVWAYNSCDNSAPLTMTFNTALDPPTSPAAGTHVATLTTIDWNWNAVSGAAGYKFNTTNNYGTAQEMGTATTFAEASLTCYTSYDRYVWA